MLQYDFDAFLMWLAQQPGGPAIMSALTRPQLWHLHNAMDAFRTEVETRNEAINAQAAAMRAALLQAAPVADSPASTRCAMMRDRRHSQ